MCALLGETSLALLFQEKWGRRRGILDLGFSSSFSEGSQSLIAPARGSAQWTPNGLFPFPAPMFPAGYRMNAMQRCRIAILGFVILELSLSWSGPALAVVQSETAGLDPAKLDFFESRIRPALIEHCYECHSAEAKEANGKLLLDSQPAMRRGGERGDVLAGDR